MIRLNMILFALTLLVPTAWAKPVFDSFDSDGVEIHYSVRGEGEPILFIHGYQASASLNFGIPGLLTAAAENYKVIALDNRGHGKSDKPETVEEYGAIMAEDSVRLLDHLGIESAHVIGYSMGGMITMKLLAEHPERVRSAIIGGMGWIDSEGDSLGGRARDPKGTKAMIACREGFTQLGITSAQLKEIKTPAIVLIGDNDGLYERTVKPMEKVRPDIPVIMIEDANHTNCCFKPQFREEMLKFFAEQSK